jgi:hypothetical protein
MRDKLKDFEIQKQQLQGLAKKLLQTEDFNSQMKAMNMNLQESLTESQRQKNEVLK